MINYKITIFGLIIINLMNWLDSILTYIALYIIPRNTFYETNDFIISRLSDIGFVNMLIFKIFQWPMSANRYMMNVSLVSGIFYKTSGIFAGLVIL